MNLKSALPILAIGTLAACSGDATADADIAKLLQTGKVEEVVKIVESRLQTVEKGSLAEKALVLDYAEALSITDADQAQERFIAFAEANADLVTPKDFKLVVHCLRTHGGYVPAIDVMHAGKTRWPDDADMVELVKILEGDVEASKDPAAQNKMRGLGYLGGKK